MSSLAFVTVTSESLCLAICLILFICQCAGDSFRDKLSVLYTRMLLLTSGVLVSSIAGWLVDGNTQPWAVVTARVSTFCLHFFWYIFAVIIFYYVYDFISLKVQLPKLFMLSAYALAAVMIVLLIISQFTGWFYYHDEENFYKRGPLHIVSYSPMLTCFAAMFLIIQNRKRLAASDKLTLALFLFLPVFSLFPQIAVYGFFSLNTCISVGLLILYARIQIVRGKEREMELVNARVAIMLSQIQPHFLYNTLATIENVMHRDADKASEMIIDFSHYLRVNMNSLNQTKLIPFEQEAEHIATYLNFEKIRFKDRLQVVTDYEVTDFHLPMLTLQPLIENAVRHGLNKKPEGGTVRIATKRTHEGVEITVADDGVGFEPSRLVPDGKTHVGLENVRSRLAVQCGGTLTVESAVDGGTAVTVKIPAAGGFR